MKISCKIIEDLLPMYHDGICSDDSAAMIEEHLRECPDCSRVLAALQGEIEVSQTAAPDDLKPLEEIRQQITKEKKRFGRKSVVIMLSILAAIMLIWTSVWYFGYAIYYDQLAKPLESVTDEASVMTTAGHALEFGDHVIALKHPGFLGEGGFVHVGPKEGMVIFLDEDFNEIGQDKEMYIDMFFYPEFGGGYRYAIILDNGNESWWVWLTPELSYNYDLYDSASRPEEEIARIEELLIEYHDEIVSLFDIVYAVWGIEYLTVS